MLSKCPSNSSALILDFSGILDWGGRGKQGGLCKCMLPMLDP